MLFVVNMEHKLFSVNIFVQNRKNSFLLEKIFLIFVFL